MSQIFNGTAEQIENNQNKVTSINSASTDVDYPSAKAVYNYAQKDLVFDPQSDNLQTGKTVAQALKRFDTVLEQGNTFIFDGGFPGEAFDIGYTTDSELDIQSLNPVTNKKLTETQNENLKQMKLNSDGIQNTQTEINTVENNLTQLETTIMNLIYPEGNTWNNLSVKSPFTVFADEPNAIPQFKVFGNVITISGMIRPTKPIEMNDYTLIVFSNIPQKYAPKKIITTVCNGYGINKWVLRVTPQGQLCVEKHGTSQYLTIQPNAWMPFNITYQI